LTFKEFFLFNWIGRMIEQSNIWKLLKNPKNQ
jgi:hypothetical protein